MASYNFKIAYLATYPPRECGIATYTSDLVKAISRLNRQDPQIIAINNGENDYNYGPEVKFQIQEDTKEDYINAANWVNESDIQLVNIQHEYGILGPKSKDTGEYILEFTKRLKKPFVITYHTVLSGPSATRIKIIQKLSNTAQASIVMVGLGKKYLKEIYEISSQKIKMIHHGVPDIGLLEPTQKYKSALGYGDRIVLSTFGLVNTGKGNEYVIRALPKLIKKYPNLIYLILGQTHPHVKKRDGEAYREKLESEIKKYHLEDYVHFENRYLSLEEIVEYLRATDIYITPYLEPQQITSGTLAYAIGAGRPCISTRYLYAKEFLKNGRGLLIEYRSPQSIATKIDYLLSRPIIMKTMAKKNYILGRSMVWSAVTKQNLRLYKKILSKKPWVEKLGQAKKVIISPALKAIRILDTSKK